jgi:hypothetical protein
MARASGLPRKTTLRHTKRSTLLLLLPAKVAGSSPLATSRHDATYPRPAHRRKGYSPKCLDATFSEGRRFLGALEHIHSPRIGVWCLRCVASGRRVKAQDSYLPTF